MNRNKRRMTFSSRFRASDEGGRMNNRPMKMILGVFVGTVLSISMLALYLGYQMEWKQTTIAIYDNAETGHRVVFQEIGETFLFGPSKVEICLEDETGKALDAVTARIYNDGSNLDNGNLTVKWTDGGVQIILHGDEQEDEIHELCFPP